MSREETSNSKAIRRLRSSEISTVSVFAYYSPFFLSPLCGQKYSHHGSFGISTQLVSLDQSSFFDLCYMFPGGKPDWLFLG